MYISDTSTFPATLTPPPRPPPQEEHPNVWSANRSRNGSLHSVNPGVDPPARGGL